MNSLELREQFQAQYADSKAFNDRAIKEGRADTAEFEQEWAKRMVDLDATRSAISKAERTEKLEAVEAETRAIQPRRTSPSQPAHRSVTRADRNKALKSWLGYGAPVNGLHYDGEVMQRCTDSGYTLQNNTVNFRSINTGTASAGGDATFTTTSPDLQTEMKYYSPILDKVKINVTSDGNTFVLPRATDVANLMSIVAQSGSSATNVDPSFDKVSLGSYMFRGVELVSYEMLADSVFDLEAWITDRLAERGGRTLEKFVVTGTGSSQPTGLVTAAVAADAGTPAITLAATHKSFYRFEDLMTLFASVDLAYRPNCTLVLNDTSVWDLRRIVDANGRYIWDLNNTLVQNAQPDKIAGFNYLVSNSIDASNAFSKNIAIFADLSRYNVRMVEGMQIRRLNELYAGSGQVGFEFLMRWDGNYLGHAASIARARTPAS